MLKPHRTSRSRTAARPWPTFRSSRCGMCPCGTVPQARSPDPVTDAPIIIEDWPTGAGTVPGVLTPTLYYGFADDSLLDSIYGLPLVPDQVGGVFAAGKFG